ncbi:CDC27 family protein [bacterium]|nr:CDC27 family protein [bacterium]QQR56293.1 MAG: CDC27 family protein [Candidatus Melainabacteria bacterium]
MKTELFKNSGKLALVYVLAATAQLHALAATSAYESYGLRYYQAKDYTSAAGYFKKLVDQNPSNAKSHYLYGLALIQLGKKNDALAQFSQSFHLDPASSYAGQIKALLHKNNYKANPSDLPPAASSQSENITAPVEDDSVKPEELESVRRRLPKINTYTPSGPSLSNFMGWSSFAQGSYLFGGARQVLAEAESNMRASQAQLEEAKKQIDVALPVFPNYGETPDDFKRRRARVQKGSQVLLEPYQELANECRSKYQDALAIKNKAEEESNRGSVVSPYWIQR